jgi:hypothetical protein
MIKTGTYSGDGTEEQAITGIGFQPKFVFIWPEMTADAQDKYWSFKADQACGIYAGMWGATTYTQDNRINSLDSDGFTVDDDASDYDPNKNTVTYGYICLG